MVHPSDAILFSRFSLLFFFIQKMNYNSHDSILLTYWIAITEGLSLSLFYFAFALIILDLALCYVLILILSFLFFQWIPRWRYMLSTAVVQIQILSNCRINLSNYRINFSITGPPTWMHPYLVYLMRKRYKGGWHKTKTSMNK